MKRKRNKSNPTMSLSGKRIDVRDALLINAVTPDIHESRRAIEVDEDICRMVDFTDYLTDNDLDWASVIFNQPNMPVAIRMEPCDITWLKDAIDQHQNQIEGGFRMGRDTASRRDEDNREIAHGNEILQQLGDEGERFFNVTIQSMIRSATHEQLDRDTAYFRSAVKAAGMNFKVIPDNQLNGFLGASPLRWDNPTGWEQTCRPMPSKTLGWTLFTKEPGLDDGIGATIGHDAANGIVRLDFITRTATRLNANMVFFGGSGSGKTTAAKKLLLAEYVIYGSKIIILDPENEFSGMVRALGGDVITIGASSSAKLSPFQPRAIVFGDQENGDGDNDDNALGERVLLSTIPFVKSFLQLAFAIDENLMDALGLALEITYKRFGIDINTTFDDFYSQQMSYPVMSDLRSTLLDLKSEDAEHQAAYDRLAMKTREAAEGIYAALWNQRTSINTGADIVCIVTEDMGSDENMKQAQYYNLLSWIWSEVRVNPRTGKPIRVVMDEAHNCVSPRSPMAADMVKNMVKRIRKRDGGTTIITQEVNDFLAPAIKMQGAAICNNATYKFLGQSEGENLTAITEIYALQPELAERIRKAEAGNFALFAGTNDKTWVKVDVEKWEWDLFKKMGML